MFSIVYQLVLACACFISASSTGTEQSLQCNSTQYAEVGEDGYIRCNISFEFISVFWSESNNTVVIASYNKRTAETRTKDGYTVYHNGDLGLRNVTTEHEKTYRVQVFDLNDNPSRADINLKTFIKSDQQRPNIDSCNASLCYEHHRESARLECSFNAARPPAEVQWNKKISHTDYVKDETQPNVLPNPDGTYNASTHVTVRSSQGEDLTVWVCRSKWLFPKHTLETSVLVDFYSPEDIVNAPPVTKNVEIYKRSELRCRDSEPSPLFNVWRKVISAESIVTIGYQSFESTRVLREDGTMIEENGDLVFRSPDLTQEGTYICIYHDGSLGVSRMTKLYMRVLIPPTPPYLFVEGCPGYKECKLNIANHPTLNCSLTGFRPSAKLQWETNAGGPIEIRHTSRSEFTRVDVFDVSISASYEVTGVIYCGDEITVTCSAIGEVSALIKSKDVKLIPGDTCTQRPASPSQQQLPTWVPVIIVIVLIWTAVITFVIIYFFCHVWKHRNERPPDKEWQEPHGRNNQIEMRNLENHPGTPNGKDQRDKPDGNSGKEENEEKSEVDCLLNGPPSSKATRMLFNGTSDNDS